MNTSNLVNFKNIIKHFNVKGEFISCEPYGEGHINTTYLVTINQSGKEVWYILQKINTNLFKNVDELMSNITLVTEFARNKIIEKGGNPERETLNVIKTKDNKSYYKDSNSGCYRIYNYITDSITYQIVKNKEDFYQAAVAFGNFAKLLSEFDASKLYEILPKFHDTRKRFNDFMNSLQTDKFNRAKEVQKEIEFVISRKEYTSKIVLLLESGEMPLKVTHNDTKLNNVLFDARTGNYLTVIDLDTIMPGSICYDFGDSIRFGCNPCSEDERDLTKVNFDIELFETYVKGCLTALGNSVTQTEKDNLVWGAILMTYECGMRFLADYLDGDIYFRTHREGQNLDRARTQFKLVADMEKNFDKLQDIVNLY